MAELRLKSLVGLGTERSHSDATGIKILALLRESRLPRPDLVLQFGDLVLSRLSETSREYWDVAAQICTVAGELGEYEIMDSLFARIMARFPRSVRSFVLLGRAHEAKSRWGDAMESYIEVIKEEPMAPVVYKRQIAVFKSEMKLPQAVSLLNHYLSLYPGDTDGWAELCAMCLSLGRLSHAVFAASELVISDPRNHAYQTLAGDVYMTSGGKDNLILARQHYACSLKARTAGNLRALFGLWLACSNLLDNGLLSKEEEDSRNSRLLAVAQSGLQAVYGKQKNDANTNFVAATALAVVKTDIVTGAERT